MAFLSAASVNLQHRTAGPLLCSFIGKSSAPSLRPARFRVACAPPQIVRCCTGAPPDAPVREVPFEIRGFSLANVGLGLGLVITLVSLSSYLSSSGTASATSLGFVYGVPILLIGCALKYAELQPVPLASSPDARALRESAATDIQKKIVSDVTRHRYGDEAHLSAAMSALGLVPKGAACPALLSAAERDRDGKYVLALEFYSVETPYKHWEERVQRMERFFGPDVTVEIEKLDGEKRLVELRLVSQR
jgi:hypothetical protein